MLCVVNSWGGSFTDMWCSACRRTPTHFAGDCSSDGPLLDIKNFKNKGGAADGVMAWTAWGS